MGKAGETSEMGKVGKTGRAGKTGMTAKVGKAGKAGKAGRAGKAARAGKIRRVKWCRTCELAVGVQLVAVESGHPVVPVGGGRLPVLGAVREPAVVEPARCMGHPHPGPYIHTFLFK